jgi:glutathione transport system ATP-binding protein
MGVVADIADRVLVMHRASGGNRQVEQIFHAPAHPYTKALLAAVPRLGAMNGSDLPRRFPLISPSLGRRRRNASRTPWCRASPFWKCAIW